eukprot:TRINITY_DN2523_c2_g1_i1.p1 TRINITY_DN2523_c2_g1~~TRINITY_DN2523_c2_g1_i1.p1  ORF type:complete len:564 (-),score=118.85 TRINITY_DN2523_c2_g1_i1:864-2555(-)
MVSSGAIRARLCLRVSRLALQPPPLLLLLLALLPFLAVASGASHSGSLRGGVRVESSFSSPPSPSPSSPSSPSSPIKVDPATHGFVDSEGRHRIFHGVNMVYKVPPYHPITSHFDPQLSVSSQDIADLAHWGFTMARVGLMWPGAEPIRGQYNETYLEVLEDLVNSLGHAGIFSLLDVHQDLFSRFFCGEGAPDWAVHTSTPDRFSFPWPLPYHLRRDNATGYPLLADCEKQLFAEYYAAAEVGAAFEGLYDNAGGVQDSFVAFWQHAAKRFAGNPFVLGYEIINEPLCGNFYREPKLLLDMGYADTKNLAPLYDRVNAAIRQVDDEHIVFFEPAVSDFFKSGFSQGPGGAAYNDRQAYSYHVYCLLVNRTGDPVFINQCERAEEHIWTDRVADYERIGCGGFMTEFGDNSNATSGLDNLRWMTEQADKYLQSWAYWAFKEFHDITTQGFESFYNIKGELEVGKLKELSRTHPQATAGTPLSLSFSAASGEMSYKYALNKTISAPTVIYANAELYYPQGWSVDISPHGAASWAVEGVNRILVRPDSSTPDGEVITIVVSPLAP